MSRRFLQILQSHRSYSTDRPYSTAIGVISNLDDAYFNENLTTTTTTTKAIPRPYNEIPGPKALPLFGNSWRFAPIIGHYKIHELDKVMWSLFKDYGRIVKVSGLIGHPDLLFVFDGDDIEKVFKREERMPHRPSMPSLHYYKQHLKKDFFEDNPGVIGVHGPKWEEFRKQVQHALLQPQIARKYVTPLDQIAGDFIVRMEETLDDRNELPDNFLSEIYKWALESVAMVSLDTRLGCLQTQTNENSEPQRIINSINTFFWNVAEVELKMPIWRLYQNRAFRDYIGALEDFRRLCSKHINNAMETMKKQNSITKDNCSIVERILAKTENPKIAAILALDLLLVGVDTTSIAAASTIYQLSQNEEKQQMLYEKLRELLPDPESPVTNEILEKTSYLKACIRETLRLYPVIIGNGRSLQSDMIIGGYNVPKGTHVIFPHLVVSHSREYFDNPESFIPERWLDNRTQCPQQRRIHPFVSLPFGYGRRSCLGRRFAEMELQIFLAKLFRKYKIEYHYEPLTYKITPTYVPKQPLRFRLIQRE